MPEGWIAKYLCIVELEVIHHVNIGFISSER